MFVQILNTEKKRDEIKNEDFVEIIYQNHFIILKKIPKEKKAEGELTAFSLFSEYGIEYHPTHNYYVEQDSESKIGRCINTCNSDSK